MSRKCKNLVISIMAVCLLIGMTACGESTNGQQTVSDSSKSETLTPVVDVMEESEMSETELQDTKKMYW